MLPATRRFQEPLLRSLLLCLTWVAFSPAAAQAQNVEADTLFYFQPDELINERMGITANVIDLGIRFDPDTTWPAYALTQLHILFDSTLRDAIQAEDGPLFPSFYVRKNLTDNTPGQILDTVTFTLQDTTHLYPYWQIVRFYQGDSLPRFTGPFWITGYLMSISKDTTSPASGHSYVFFIDTFGNEIWGSSFIDWAVKAVVERKTVDISNHTRGFLPSTASLAPNYPNPFNPATTIRYALPEASRVTLAVYDIMGREVRRWDLQEEPGYKQVVWDGRDHAGQPIPSGIYIYRLDLGGFSQSKKMLLLR